MVGEWWMVVLWSQELDLREPAGAGRQYGVVGLREKVVVVELEEYVVVEHEEVELIQ